MLQPFKICYYPTYSDSYQHHQTRTMKIVYNNFTGFYFALLIRLKDLTRQIITRLWKWTPLRKDFKKSSAGFSLIAEINRLISLAIKYVLQCVCLIFILIKVSFLSRYNSFDYLLNVFRLISHLITPFFLFVNCLSSSFNITYTLQIFNDHLWNIWRNILTF